MSSWQHSWSRGPGRRTSSLIGEGGLLGKLTKMVLENALEGEMSDHLGYESGDPAIATGATPATGIGPRPCSPRSGRSSSRCGVGLLRIRDKTKMTEPVPSGQQQLRKVSPGRIVLDAHGWPAGTARVGWSPSPGRPNEDPLGRGARPRSGAPAPRFAVRPDEQLRIAMSLQRLGRLVDGSPVH